MKELFRDLFGKGRKSPSDQKDGNAVRPIEPQRENTVLYKHGDLIGGVYEVQGTLGKGGFGIVYLVKVRYTSDTLALKTFRDELLGDPTAREAFKKEALLWVELERHPFILSAEWVDEVSARLYVAMEYVAPDAQGRTSLADYLSQAGEPIDTNHALKWGIQFCLGMEHARAHGIKCHRDIKPDNILISKDGTLRISDFGLAAAAERAWRVPNCRKGLLVTGSPECGFSFGLMPTEGKLRCGTPGYIAPEVYRCEGADIRSDIYSFGLVLWQMATSSRLPPFIVPWHGDMESYMRAIYEQQMANRAPIVKEPLGPIIARCLRANPSERYNGFQELHKVMEPIWMKTTGTKFEIPHFVQRTACLWSNKGAALKALDRHEEALSCYNKALTIDPRHATAWINKSISLLALGRHEEAITAIDRALAIEPKNTHAWRSKGAMLDGLDRHKEAIDCFDKALAIDPQDAVAWYNKGVSHRALGTLDPWASTGFKEAVRCLDKALAIDPLQASAWNEKGLVHRALGRESGDHRSYVAALQCFDKALATDTLNMHAWCNKAATLDILGLREDAIECCIKALAIEPGNAALWYTKALAEDGLEHWHEAMSSYQKVAELAPLQYAQAISYVRQRLHELKSKKL